jgi:nucleotidyltransferase substrate binding protein (TIGR01987 family)
MTPPTEIRWPQRLANFEGALNQLEKEGVIELFEYCFELVWKTSKDYMEANGFVFAVVMPRQVLKEAYAAKIIADGEAAIQERYLPALEQLKGFMQLEAAR